MYVVEYQAQLKVVWTAIWLEVVERNLVYSKLLGLAIIFYSRT